MNHQPNIISTDNTAITTLHVAGLKTNDTVFFNPFANSDYLKQYYKKQKISVFNPEETLLHYAYLFIWLLALSKLIHIWFLESTIYSIPLFVLVSVNVFWLPLITGYFFIYSFNQKKNSKINKLTVGRLALITTKIPNEPWLVVKNTLLGMLNQSYPYKYDVWLADEDPQQETLEWCNQNNVKISTRKGNPHYFNETHPRKKKCKEGNLMYFYDNYGFKNYDFVIQFDADHKPEYHFATEVMKEFSDPNVGYVASPSICDLNLGQSWTVKARLFWESTLHGPIQHGANSGLAPVCFGSHYSMRINALKDIGGIGPEVAEDYTTTAMMNAHGWKGGFAGNAIAHGMGAVGIKDSMHQEYQWALVGVRASILVIPKIFFKFSNSVKFQSIIWTFWYPALSFVTLISLIFPAYALITQAKVMTTNAYQFWIIYLFMNISFIFYLFILRSKKMLRPYDAWGVSWETMIFQLLQFPWILIGVIDGLIQVITGYNPFGSTKRIKITDKSNAVRGINFKYFLPHFIIIIINILAMIIAPKTSYNTGYFWFAWVNAFAYSSATSLGSILSISEASTNQNSINWNYIRTYFPTISVSIILFILSCASLFKIII
jgi:cellulose synthase (UDP-forming)